MKTTHSPSNLIPAVVFFIIILALLATKWMYGQTPAPASHAGVYPPTSATMTAEEAIGTEAAKAP